MQYDEITTCPRTNGNLCYKTQITQDISNYLSLSSGFWTNSLMKEGEEFYETQMEILPELHKDLAWKDPKTDLIWLPNTINIPDKGMVFASGVGIHDWYWAAVRAIEIPEEEREKHPIPGKPGEFMKHKMDMKNMKKFSENDFIEAIDYIGIFENSLEDNK